jgi:hypothetical protein
MHHIVSIAFHKMVAKHRDNLIQYRKAIAAFILKTEVGFGVCLMCWLLTFSAECS